MTDWRREARTALYGYAKAKRRGEDTSAVDLALSMQDRYYNAAARRRMGGWAIWTIYGKRSKQFVTDTMPES